MREQRNSEPRDGWQRVTQIGDGDVLEFVDTRRTQKALEPEDACARERLECIGVARHNTAPETDVDVAPISERTLLLLKAAHGGRRRDAVERHVDQRRDAARGSGARGVVGSLPVGAPRVVHMDVSVDHTRHDDQIPGVQLAHAGCLLGVWCDIDDLAVVDVNRSSTHAIGTDDPLASNDERTHCVCFMRVGRSLESSRTAPRWRRRLRSCFRGRIG